MTRFMLGMPTLIELPDVEANVRLARELGLGFVELNMNVPAFCPAALPAARLRELGAETGLAFTLHLPEETDLASFHPAVRRGHLEGCLEAVRWAADAGMALVNLHLSPGVYFTLPERRVWVYDVHREQFQRNLAESFSRLLGAAADCGVTVCVENAGDFGREFVRQALEGLLRLPGERLRLTWDLGHDAAAAWSDRPVFERWADRVAHVHLHDFDGAASHRVLFDGEVDVAAALELARSRGLGVVVEVKTAESLAESVRRLDERGLR